MKIVQAWKEPGVQIPEPFKREIKLLLGPDKGNVDVARINLVIIPPGGRTNSHEHDRPEMIFVIEGEGLCRYENGSETIIKDTLIWVEKGDSHQILNESTFPLKLLTLFIPGFTSEKALYQQQLYKK